MPSTNYTPIPFSIFYNFKLYAITLIQSQKFLHWKENLFFLLHLVIISGLMKLFRFTKANIMIYLNQRNEGKKKKALFMRLTKMAF